MPADIERLDVGLPAAPPRAKAAPRGTQHRKNIKQYSYIYIYVYICIIDHQKKKKKSKRKKNRIVIIVL